MGAEPRHPRGLIVLYATEVWERFSFYGMRALLVLYLNDGVLGEHRFSKVIGSGLVTNLFGQPASALETQALSSTLNELYSGIAYVTPILGGVVSDWLLGARTTLLLGGFLMAFGHLCMAFEATFLIGLVLLVLGNGGFKPTVTTMLGHLYEAPDLAGLRDSGFAIFYTGINVGALVAPLACGALQQHFGYDVGFGAAGVGMCVGLVTFLLGSPWLRLGGVRTQATRPTVEADDNDGSVESQQDQESLLPRLKEPPTCTETVEASTGGATAAVSPMPAASGMATMLALAGLCGLVIPFWVPFEQAANTVPLFVRDLTNRDVLPGGYAFPTAWLQSFNPLFCIVLMPLLTSLWAWQRRRGLEPSPMMKMAMGSGLQGVGWTIFSLGSVGVTPGAKAPLALPVASLFLLAIGQLYMCPVGLALVSRCCPPHARSTAVGLWFLAGGLGGGLAGPVGALYGAWPATRFFALLGGISFAAAASMAACAPRMQRLLAGRYPGDGHDGHRID